MILLGKYQCKIMMSICLKYINRNKLRIDRLKIQYLMFKFIPPPTQKAIILRRILLILTILTAIQGLFLMFTYGYKTLIYFLSFMIYIITIRSLSYFGCIINQFINITFIWFLLIQMAIKLKVGLYEIYLSSQGIFKMSSLIFGVVSLYFNFLTYKQFKQIAYEIYQQQNLQSERQQSFQQQQMRRNPETQWYNLYQ